MSISKRVRFQVLERDGFRCRYCGASADDTQLHVDHEEPKCIGGPDHPDNLVAACRDCNLGKGRYPLAGPRFTCERITMTFAGGPFDGQVRRVVGPWPIVWVVSDPPNGLVLFDDRLVQRYPGAEIELRNGVPPIFGEPGHTPHTIGYYSAMGLIGYRARKLRWSEGIESLLCTVAPGAWWMEEGDEEIVEVEP